MSKLCDQVVETLRLAFPHIRIVREKHLTYRNQSLYLDIFIPQLDLVVEVHGRQHDEFVEHFHGSADNFRSYKRRDSLKEEWVAENGLTLLVLREVDLPIDIETLLERIDEAHNG